MRRVVNGPRGFHFIPDGTPHRGAGSPMKGLMMFIGWAALATAAWGAEDPGARALQQHQLQRQQQQEALQLRMQQQQRSVQESPADARQQQALEQLQINQQQQQQELHYRQGIEPTTAQPSEGEGTRGAKAQIELQKAQQQSQQQLRRFESELQVKPGAATDLSRKMD
jgi:hypothetical protein